VSQKYSDIECLLKLRTRKGSSDQCERTQVSLALELSQQVMSLAWSGGAVVRRRRGQEAPWSGDAVVGVKIRRGRRHRSESIDTGLELNGKPGCSRILS
jgi:hypothetical protein